MKYDAIVKLLGDFGPYQKRLYFLLCIPMISVGIQTMLTVFTLGVPDHRCALPDWDNDTYTIQGEQHQNAVLAAIPPATEGTQLYSSCLIRNAINETDGQAFNTNSTRKCEKWVYDSDMFSSTVVTKFGWVCDMKLTKSHAQMMFMLGSLVGSVLLVSPSDFIGRKKMFMVSVLLHIVSTIVTAFSPSFAIIGILYFIIGMSGIAIWSNAFVVGVELVGPSKRVLTGIICELYWTFGVFLATTIAYFVRDWRHLQLIVSTPTALFLAYYWFMPESPRWLISKRKFEEADRILRHAAKINKTTLPPNIFSQGMLQKKTEEPLCQIFTSPSLVIRSLVIFLNWFVVSLGFYGLGLNVASLGGSVYTNVFISAGAELVGHIACLLLLDRIGRKSLHCTCMLLGGVCCTATLLPVVYGGGSLNWLTITLALTGRGFAVASFDVIWLYSSELFPTVIRNSALAAANISARVGGTISPYIANLALVITGDFGRAVPLIIFGTSMAVAGLAALALPETLNNPLPDTIEDARQMKRRSRRPDITRTDYIRSNGEELADLQPNGCVSSTKARV
ncbi:organic cation transporter protein-like [Haliotis rubra]|uniref:organic cation transporter protein-like n=1 Tax=Haliotis rubra TaxID=36100 RepID=UPI001EE55D7D|nr:organic cation transporter protein-like [Haliotis rubra]